METLDILVFHPQHADEISDLLEASGHNVDAFDNIAIAIDSFGFDSYDFIITHDSILDSNYDHAFRLARSRNPNVIIWVVCDKEDQKNEVDKNSRGANKVLIYDDLKVDLAIDEYLKKGAFYE